MRISRHDLRRRYSNSLVIDAGSQFSLRACSQANSDSNCSSQNNIKFLPKYSFLSMLATIIIQAYIASAGNCSSLIFQSFVSEK